jgi:uncharacterized protein
MIIKNKIKIASRYVANRSISPIQAFLKSSLVPLKDFDMKLPLTGIILDLGCGEGILTNLVAKIRPYAQVIGLDYNNHRLKIAQKNSEKNTSFIKGDILELNSNFKNISAIILNDVVHHQNYAEHQKLILQCLKRLKIGGVLILKEVDQKDLFDSFMTKFFDSKLYPNDPLCFRTKDEWLSLFSRLGVNKVDIKIVNHPWPASRTVFYAFRPRSLADPYSDAKKISDNNKKFANIYTNVFITGASGFLGTYLVDILKKEGLNGKPVRLICLSRGRKKLSAPSQNFTQVSGDLHDMQYLNNSLQNVEYIFHLAAEVKLSNGIDLFRNNYYGTVTLIEAAKKFTIKRFIYASTIGAIDRSLTDNCSNPLDELNKPNPMSMYGRTKLLGEQYLSNSGIPYSTLRVTWAYGKGMTPDTHVRFLTDGFFKGKFFSKFFFPGKVSLIAASDVARAFSLISTHPKAKNQIFFVSDGKPIAIGNLFQIYASVIGKPINLISLPKPLIFMMNTLRRFFPLTLQSLTNDILVATPKKLMSLGYKNKICLRNGLRILAFDQGHITNSKYNDRISIVTGAASGIGKALAIQMAKEGHDLLLIDKDLQKLRVLAKDIDCDYLLVDLSDKNSTSKIYSFLKSRKKYLDWLINNAGIGSRGEFSNSELSKLKEIIIVNCLSLMNISHLFLQYAKKTNDSTLVNIGSSSGFQPLPFMAVYAASKSFVQSFTLAISAELAKSKTKIILIDPSGVDTQFQSSSGVKKNISEKLLTPQETGAKIIDSVYKKKTSLIIGKTGKIMALISKLVSKKFSAMLWFRLMKNLR